MCSVNSVGVFTLYKYLCGSVQSVGEYPLPVCSVCSVKSVGASLRLRGRSLLLKRKLPQNSQNSQKFIAEKKTPTEFTEYTEVYCSKENSHRIHGIHRSLLLKRKLPRNSRNTQKFIAQKKTPTDFTDLHRCKQNILCVP